MNKKYLINRIKTVSVFDTIPVFLTWDHNKTLVPIEYDGILNENILVDGFIHYGAVSETDNEIKIDIYAIFDGDENPIYITEKYLIEKEKHFN